MTYTPVVLVSFDAPLLAALLAMIGCFALGLRLRSWTWWLAGYGATILTLMLMWRAR